MTTIAYKDGWIAADSQLTISNLVVRSGKLTVVPNIGIVSFAGAGASMVQIEDWWAGGCKGDPPSAPASVDEETCRGILVSRNGLFYLEGGVHPIKVDSPFFAIGSGCDFAMMAMHLGLSAKEAVEATALFDCWTGHPVTELECAKHFKRTSK